MKYLIVDNSIHRFFVKEGKWTARYVTGDIEIKNGEDGLKNVNPAAYDRIILTGSEASIVNVKPWMQRQIDFVCEAVEKSVPLLGICFGHQMIALALGGHKCVRRSPKGEFGWFQVQLMGDSKIFNGVKTPTWQLCSHFDEVVKPPPNFNVIARTPGCAVQGMAMKGKPVWGLQFHPEITINEGKQLLYFIKLTNPSKKIGVRTAVKTARDSETAKTIFRNFQGLL